MIKNYKMIFSVVALSISGFLPLFTINNRILTVSKQHQSNSISQTFKTKQVNVGRRVHKFTGLRPKNNQNLFQKLKEQLANTNINIKLNNSSNYNFSIEYDNYDVFNTEHKGLVSTINKKNSTNNSINVGIKLLDKMTINISNNLQKNWKSLKLHSLTQLDFKKVDPASIFYSISASGTKSSPTISFSRSYKFRDSKTPNSQIFGYFNVPNINNSAKNFFTHEGAIIPTIIAAIILVLSILIIARVSYDYYQYYRSFHFEGGKELIADPLSRRPFYARESAFTEPTFTDPAFKESTITEPVFSESPKDEGLIRYNELTRDKTQTAFLDLEEQERTDSGLQKNDQKRVLNEEQKRTKKRISIQKNQDQQLNHEQWRNHDILKRQRTEYSKKMLDYELGEEEARIKQQETLDPTQTTTIWDWTFLRWDKTQLLYRDLEEEAIK